MKPPGTYKLTHRNRLNDGDELLDPLALSRDRAQRIVDSLRHDISTGSDTQRLRIRRIFETPRPIYRIELNAPDIAYQRTTLLDGDALEELLEADEVQSVLEKADL